MNEKLPVYRQYFYIRVGKVSFLLHTSAIHCVLVFISDCWHWWKRFLRGRAVGRCRLAQTRGASEITMMGIKEEEMSNGDMEGWLYFLAVWIGRTLNWLDFSWRTSEPTYSMHTCHRGKINKTRCRWGEQRPVFALMKQRWSVLSDVTALFKNASCT